MKKILFTTLVAIILCPSMGFAQKNKRRYDFTPGSDISISYGFSPLDIPRDVSGRSFGFYYYDVEPYSYSTPINYPSSSFWTLNQIYDTPSVRRGESYLSGAINVTYTYRFKRWFELSGSLTYSGYYANYYDAYSTELAYKKTGHSIGITPFVRFVYLNRKYVKLYSGLGLGLGVYFTHYKDSPSFPEYQFATESTLCLYPTLNIFGIRAGDKVYGLLELSIGTMGVVNVGVGIKL